MRIRYFGWSSLALEAPNGTLAFDPFFRPYCGAKWSSIDDYADAKVVCVTHGHEERGEAAAPRLRGRRSVDRIISPASVRGAIAVR